MSGWVCILETTTADVRKSPGFCVACQDASMLCDAGVVFVECLLFYPDFQCL